MHAADTPILAVAGFAMQYLRAHKWFGDGATMLAAGAFALTAVLLNHRELHDWRDILFQTFEHFPAVLGGTMLAHMGAQITPVVPKFNSAAGAPTNGGSK